MKKAIVVKQARNNEQLVESAQALLTATANVAEEKVAQARKRLTVAVAKARAAWETVQDTAVATAKAADKSIRKHPYRALGVAVGTGLAAGYYISRRNRK